MAGLGSDKGLGSQMRAPPLTIPFSPQTVYSLAGVAPHKCTTGCQAVQPQDVLAAAGRLPQGG